MGPLHTAQDQLTALLISLDLRMEDLLDKVGEINRLRDLLSAAELSYQNLMQENQILREELRDARNEATFNAGR